MKIISKVKDYYDSGMAYGIDDTIHYVRHEGDSDVSGNILKILDPKGWCRLDYHYPRDRFFNGREIENYYLRYLLFCGKVYPIVIYSYIPKNGSISDKITNTLIGYDECLDFYEQVEVTKNKWDSDDLSNTFKERIKLFTDKLIIDEHVKYKSPILYYTIKSNWVVTLDKNLKGLRFFRVMDPFTAFQEISMFLGSTLCDVSTPKMPVGGDKVILNSKGFDPKYGFRTRPNKNK